MNSYRKAHYTLRHRMIATLSPIEQVEFVDSVAEDLGSGKPRQLQKALVDLDEALVGQATDERRRRVRVERLLEALFRLEARDRASNEGDAAVIVLLDQVRQDFLHPRRPLCNHVVANR